MELRQYLSVLWRRKWAIIVTVVVATTAVAIGSYSLTPEYIATATLWVPASTGDNVGSGDILLNDRLMNTYAELTTSDPVLAELERRLGVSREGIRSATSVRSIAQTELLQISVRHSDPVFAADVASSLAEIVIEQTQRTDAGRSLRVSLFAPAGVPDRPTWLGILSTPAWREINILLGFVVSLVAGIGLAFLFEYLDTTLYTTKQIEAATELETLGEIPVARRRSRQKALLNGNAQLGDAFRYIRTSILYDADRPIKSLLVTSAMPGEGKTTVVSNLALSIAQAGYSVVVVDANLYRPALHRIFDLSTEVGLSSLLRKEVSLPDALQDTEITGLRVITSGPLPTNPSELFDSPELYVQIERLKEAFDYVLIDSPAVLAATDAAVMSPFADGVLLVVERARAHHEQVQAARDQLRAVNARMAGIVANRAGHELDYYGA